MNLGELFSIFPPQLATLFIAMLPLGEINGALPVALLYYKLDPVSAYIFAVIGNTIPAFFILGLLGPLSGYLIERFEIARRFFTWLFNRTRHKFTGKYERWGAVALISFIAIPVPGAGAWTASVAAFLFGIPKKRALVYIFLGDVVAGFVVMGMTLGIVTLF